MAGFFPPAPQAIAKRSVELAVPWFALTLGASGVGGVLLGLYGVNQPCATQELGVAVLEYLEEEHVDRDVFVVEVADNSFGGRIEFGRAENDLVRLVEEVFIQVFAEAFFEGGIERLTFAVITVDLCDAVGGQIFHPRRIVESLRYDVAWGLVALEFDQDERGGWRYVVLDGNDVSFHAYPKGSEEAKHASEYYIENKISSPKWNGAIGAKQLAWLRSVLKNAQQNNEKVILFCHFPIYPANKHNLWNANEVIALLESFPCVKAYINGHNHHGNYGKKGGVHYVTLKGMVDTETNSYAVIRVDDERIDITGYGREGNRSLPIFHP